MYKGKRGNVKSGILSLIDQHVYTDVHCLFENNPRGAEIISGVSYDMLFSITYEHAGSNNTIGPYAAKADSNNPVPHGTDSVEIADYPHPGGSRYGDKGKVWFRIGNSGDRYIHPGRVSAGCITINPAAWPSIYEILAKGRKNSGDTDVGDVLV